MLLHDHMHRPAFAARTIKKTNINLPRNAGLYAHAEALDVIMHYVYLFVKNPTTTSFVRWRKQAPSLAEK